MGSWTIVSALESARVRGAVDLGRGLFLLGEANLPLRVEGPGLDVVALSGAGAIGTRFLRNPDDLTAWLSQNPSMAPAAIGAALRGAVSAVLWEPATGSFHVTPDPLGSSFVFMWSEGATTVVSSHLDSLIDVVGQLGTTLRKSMSYLLSTLVVGHGGYYPTSYEGVEVLPQGSLLRLSADAHEIVHDQQPDVGQATYRELLTQTRTEILNNVVAAAEAPAEHRIAHLTGGADTRLMLSALLQAGVADRFSFFCSGPDNSIDRVVSDGLIRQYGLTPTKHPGFDLELEPLSYRERTLATSQMVSGLMPAGPSLGMREPEGGSVILSGGYGGLLRSHYGSRIDPEKIQFGPDLLRQIWGNLAFGDKGQRLSSTGLHQDISERIGRKYKELASNGFNDDALMDALFLTVRNRYYVGLISSTVSRAVSRFDPLYTPVGAHWGLSLPLRDRATNVAGFDLMESMAPGLRNWEFDFPRFSDRFVSLRGAQDVKPLPANGSLPWDGRTNKVVGSAGAGLPLPTGQHVDFANSIRASAAQVAGLDFVQSQCRELVAGIGRRELEPHFDWVVLNRLLRPGLKSRGPIRSVYYLYNSLLWYYEG